MEQASQLKVAEEKKRQKECQQHMKLLSESYALQKIEEEELENLDERQLKRRKRRELQKKLLAFKSMYVITSPFIHFVVLNSPISFYNIC